MYSGDESKVPNMQDVVRKLLNALHNAIMNHMVRYFLNVTYCSESCCLLSCIKKMLHVHIFCLIFPCIFNTVTNDFDSCCTVVGLHSNSFHSRKLALPLTPFPQFTNNYFHQSILHYADLMEYWLLCRLWQTLAFLPLLTSSLLTNIGIIYTQLLQEEKIFPMMLRSEWSA